MAPALLTLSSVDPLVMSTAANLLPAQIQFLFTKTKILAAVASPQNSSVLQGLALQFSVQAIKPKIRVRKVLPSVRQIFFSTVLVCILSSQQHVTSPRTRHGPASRRALHHGALSTRHKRLHATHLARTVCVRAGFYHLAGPTQCAVSVGSKEVRSIWIRNLDTTKVWPPYRCARRVSHQQSTLAMCSAT